MVYLDTAKSFLHHNSIISSKLFYLGEPKTTKKKEMEIKILLVKLFVYSFTIIDTVRYMYRHHLQAN